MSDKAGGRNLHSRISLNWWGFLFPMKSQLSLSMLVSYFAVTNDQKCSLLITCILYLVSLKVDWLVLSTWYKPVIWEVETSTGKFPPPDWSAGKTAGHFLDYWLMWEGPTLWPLSQWGGHHWAGGAGLKASPGSHGEKHLSSVAPHLLILELNDSVWWGSVSHVNPFLPRLVWVMVFITAAKIISPKCTSVGWNQGLLPGQVWLAFFWWEMLILYFSSFWKLSVSSRSRPSPISKASSGWPSLYHAPSPTLHSYTTLHLSPFTCQTPCEVLQKCLVGMVLFLQNMRPWVFTPSPGWGSRHRIPALQW